MLAANAKPSSLWSISLALDPQENLWRGPAAASSSTLTAKPATSSVRKIRRKPVPIIPTELPQYQSSSSSTAPSASLSWPALAAKSLNSQARADTTPTQESSSGVLPKSSQKPQRQYLLDIDAPATSQDTSSVADGSVRHLLRSATISPSSASYRTRRGPLKWMQDREEHAASASLSTAASRQPTLSRKTSISAHLKMSLRRNKALEEPTSEPLTISGPTNFVHIATGGEGAQAKPSGAGLQRSSTVSARSSTSSSLSAASEGASEQSEDRPLYTAATRQPLRPLKSIRRPSKLSLEKSDVALPISAGSTSPKDKRKGICAAHGLVPAILEPIDGSYPSSASKLSPIHSPVSPGGEQFAASLARRPRSSYGGEMSPELELSRSPSSGYESSACTSTRSSLGSLHEFKSFLDFSDPPAAKAKHAADLLVWSDALEVPLAARRS